MKNEKRLVCEIDADTNYKLRLHLLQNDINISSFMRQAVNAAITKKTRNQQDEIGKREQ